MEEIIINTLKDIPGYGGKYKANPAGQIVRVYGSGKMKLMTQFLSHKKYVVKLTLDGVAKDIPAATVILLAFRGACPVGMVPYHKNRIKSDNRLDNLGYISHSCLGTMTGGRSRNKPVVKIDQSGEIVECYQSAREAGRKNNMSYQTVSDRCHGLIKRPFALDGHTYAYEDSAVSMRRAVRAAELERGGMPSAPGVEFGW